MRIALLSDTYIPQVNGVTTVVHRIAQALRTAGHGVAVVAPRYPRGSDDGGGGGDRDDELRLFSLPFPPYPSIRLSIAPPRHVARFLDRFRPDVVHVATEGPIGVSGRRYALRRNLPLVTSYHTDFPQYARYYRLPALTPLVWRWLVHFHRPARLIHTPGIATRDELVRRGLQTAVVWGRGVDIEHFHPAKRHAGWRRWLGGGDDTVIVVHVGRLAAEKNLGVLVQAWTRAHRFLGPRATFVIAGDGPQKDYIATRLPFARQLGFVDRDTLAALYASADLCVLPSRTETCGLVALEAMASGIPVVAADAGGLRESLRNDVNGLLVRPDDARGFSQAIVALAGDTSRRRSMGECARRTALSRDVRSENRELLRQYGAVVGRADPRPSPEIVSLETEGELTRC